MLNFKSKHPNKLIVWKILQVQSIYFVVPCCCCCAREKRLIFTAPAAELQAKHRRRRTWSGVIYFIIGRYVDIECAYKSKCASVSYTPEKYMYRRRWRKKNGSAKMGNACSFCLCVHTITSLRTWQYTTSYIRKKKYNTKCEWCLLWRGICLITVFFIE